MRKGYRLIYNLHLFETSVSLTTAKAVLGSTVKEGMIILIGSTRNTMYIKNN